MAFACECEWPEHLLQIGAVASASSGLEQEFAPLLPAWIAQSSPRQAGERRRLGGHGQAGQHRQPNELTLLQERRPEALLEKVRPDNRPPGISERPS